MCLAVPVEVTAIDDQNMATCRVGDSDATIQASLMIVDQPVQVGDYVLVHAGFAIRRLDYEEAQQTLTILRDLIQAAEEHGVDFGAA
ncbi:MAG: HypC/HybG/HupF family hydrogenase formation chaperone [Desulfovibrionaceae bacterium]